MILRGENLIKEYGLKKVVKAVSAQVQQGEIVGLLDPNGAVPDLATSLIVRLFCRGDGILIYDISKCL